MKQRLIKTLSALALVASISGCSSTSTTVTTTPASSSDPTSESTGETTLRVASWNVDSKAHPDITAMSDILDE